MLKKTCVATAALFAALLCVLLTASAGAQAPIVVAVPASAGAVVGTNQNSDQFIWTLFTQFAAPYRRRTAPRLCLKPGHLMLTRSARHHIGLRRASQRSCAQASCEQ
jgi:hypothetical protein